jgi:hypothetical protein
VAKQALGLIFAESRHLDYMLFGVFFERWVGGRLFAMEQMTTVCEGRGVVSSSGVMA